MGKTQTSDSFVARLWLESGTNGDQMWRGHIRHVKGDVEAYFQDMERMSDVMELFSNIPGPR